MTTTVFSELLPAAIVADDKQAQRRNKSASYRLVSQQWSNCCCADIDNYYKSLNLKLNFSQQNFADHEKLTTDAGELEDRVAILVPDTAGNVLLVEKSAPAHHFFADTRYRWEQCYYRRCCRDWRYRRRD